MSQVIVVLCVVLLGVVSIQANHHHGKNMTDEMKQKIKEKMENCSIKAGFDSVDEAKAAMKTHWMSKKENIGEENKASEDELKVYCYVECLSEGHTEHMKRECMECGNKYEGPNTCGAKSQYMAKNCKEECKCQKNKHGKNRTEGEPEMEEDEKTPELEA